MIKQVAMLFLFFVGFKICPQERCHPMQYSMWYLLFVECLNSNEKKGKRVDGHACDWREPAHRRLHRQCNLPVARADIQIMEGERCKGASLGCHAAGEGTAKETTATILPHFFDSICFFCLNFQSSSLLFFGDEETFQCNLNE